MGQDYEPMGDINHKSMGDPYARTMNPWVVHGRPMREPWASTPNPSVVDPWANKINPRVTRGGSMVEHINPHGRPMVNPWTSI